MACVLKFKFLLNIRTHLNGVPVYCKEKEKCLSSHKSEFNRGLTEPGHLDYSALSSQYGPPVIIQLAGIMAAVRLTPLKRVEVSPPGPVPLQTSVMC